MHVPGLDEIVVGKLSASVSESTAVLTLAVGGTVSPLESSHLQYFPRCSKAVCRLKFGALLALESLDVQPGRASGRGKPVAPLIHSVALPDSIRSASTDGTMRAG